MELERIKFFSKIVDWYFELYRNDKDTTHKCEYCYKKNEKASIIWCIVLSP